MSGVFGERLRAEASRLKAETEALRKDRDALRGELRRLHDEAAQVRNEMSEIRQKNIRAVLLRDEAAQLRAENADLRAEAAALRTEGAALRHENAELRGEGVALRRSHELLHCERSEQGMSGIAMEQQMRYLQQMRYRLRCNGMAEGSSDEMESCDEVEIGRCRIQAGDPIPPGPFIVDDMELSGNPRCQPGSSLGCPSPSKRARRMQPRSAGSYGGNHSLADVTLRRPPVPALCIPDPGEAVQGQYEECDSDSESDDEEEKNDFDEQLQDLEQSPRFFQKSDFNLDLLSHNPRAMAGEDLADKCRMNAAVPSHKPHAMSGEDLADNTSTSRTMKHCHLADKGRTNTAVPQDVAEPRGSSARPPRAKGSHSMEVGPSGPMCCHALGGPKTPSVVSEITKRSEIQKEDQE
jgi:hypothetical protein